MAENEDQGSKSGIFSTEEEAIRAAKAASNDLVYATIRPLPEGFFPQHIEIKPLTGPGGAEYVLERDKSGLYALITSGHRADDDVEATHAITKAILDDFSGSQRPKRPKHRPIPIKVRIYAKSDDAVDALNLVKSITDFLEDVGYGRVKIIGVTRGSMMTDLKAWWNREESEPVKKKMSEIGLYGEQWALDVTANKARAEVASINANTTATLLASVESYETIAMLIDDFLVIKYVRPDGSPFAFVKKLSIKEMRTLEENAAILGDPNTVLSKLNLLSYAKENNLELEELDELNDQDK